MDPLRLELNELEEELNEMGHHDERSSPMDFELLDDATNDKGGVPISSTSQQLRPKEHGLFGVAAADIFRVTRKKGHRSRKGLTHGKTLPKEVSQALGDAHALYVRGDTNGAINAFSAVIQMAPKLPDPYAALAIIYDDANRKMEALQLYVLAAVYTPKNPEAWRKAASLAFDLGEFDQALAAIDSVIRYERAPEDLAVAYAQKIYILLRLQEDKKAFNCLKRMLHSFPAEHAFLLEYAQECESFGLSQRALYGYIRYTLTCIGAFAPTIPTDIFLKYDCTPPNRGQGSAAVSGSSRRGSLNHLTSGARDAPASPSEVDLKALFYAVSRAALILLNLSDKSSYYSLSALGYSDLSSNSNVTSTHGITEDRVKHAHLLLKACFDFVSLLDRSLSVDAASRPSIPLDFALLFGLCDLYTVCCSKSLNDDRQVLKVVPTAPQDIPRVFADILCEITVLLGQVIKKHFRLNTSTQVSESWNQESAGSRARNNDSSLFCVLYMRIVSVFAFNGMHSMAVRYGQEIKEFLSPGNDPSTSADHPVSSFMRSYLLLELSVAYFSLEKHEDDALNTCLAAVSVSPNEIYCFRFLLTLTKKYGKHESSVTDSLGLRNALKLHFNALGVAFMFVFEDKSKRAAAPSFVSCQQPVRELCSMSSELASECLSETFQKLLDVPISDSYSPLSFLLENKDRLETELEMAILLAEQSAQVADIDVCLSVLLPIVDMYQQCCSVCELRSDSSICLQNHGPDYPVKFNVAAVICAIVLSLQGRGTISRTDLNSYLSKFLTVHGLIGMTMICSICLWTTNHKTMAATLLNTIGFDIPFVFYFAPLDMLRQLIENCSAKAEQQEQLRLIEAVLAERQGSEVSLPEAAAVLFHPERWEYEGGDKGTKKIVQKKIATERLDSLANERKRKRYVDTYYNGIDSLISGNLEISDPKFKKIGSLRKAVGDLSQSPESITASNKLARLILGELLSAAHEEIGADCIEKDLLMTPISWTEDVSLEDILSVQRFFRNHRTSVSAALMSGHAMKLNKKHGEVIERYVTAFRIDPNQPLTSLCIAVHLVYLSSRPKNSKAKHETLCKAFAFITNYAKLRLGCKVTGCSSITPDHNEPNSVGLPLKDENLALLGIKQEVFYNAGRLLQEIEELHLAQHCYHKVLAISDENPSLVGSRFELTKEAAHNLILIFRSSGCVGLCLELMKKYLFE